MEDLKFRETYKRILLALLLASLLTTSLLLPTACTKEKAKLRSIDFTLPTFSDENKDKIESADKSDKEKKKASDKASKATNKKTKDKKDKIKDKAASDAKDKKEKETKPLDFSQEFDSGNLQNHVAYTAQSYGSEENGPEVAELADLISSFLLAQGVSPDSIGIVYHDLATGIQYSHNADARFIAASVVKVPMAMVVGQFIDEGVFPADMTITYAPGEHFDSSDMDPSLLGKQVSIQELVNQALLYSANAPTSVIFEYFNRHGRAMHYFLDERTGTHYMGDTTLSAREGVNLLLQLYSDSRYSSYGIILNTMTSSTWNSFLTGGMPVAVSSKYGNLGSLNHEIGIAWAERPFAYAVFTDGISAYSVLPALGQLLYNYHIGAAVEIPSAEETAASDNPEIPEETDTATEIPSQPEVPAEPDSEPPAQPIVPEKPGTESPDQPKVPDEPYEPASPQPGDITAPPIPSPEPDKSPVPPPPAPPPLP